MKKGSNVAGRLLLRGASGLAVAAVLMSASGACAQSAAAEASGQDNAAQNNAAAEKDIVVTGTRITRAGFDQPTPTTVLGESEIRQAAPLNIQQVLNDQPQFRPSVSPTVSTGNTSAGTAPADLRGLGSNRTLTLVNGRRFVGDNNLNYVPVGLVERADVVTGGASAAYGSGAVAGVVNIVLKKDLRGFSLGVQDGISSRGDGHRYGFNGAFGTSFAGGSGHFMIGGEYVNDEGIADHNSRYNLGSSGIITLPNGQKQLVRDVNISPFGNSMRYYTPGGLILTGPLAGKTFDPDGTLRVANLPDSLGVGGTDARALYDDVPLTVPVERYSSYARLTYDVGNVTLWADGTYGRVRSNGNFVEDYAASAVGGLLAPFSATNPFLSQSIRDQLSAAGVTSFYLGRDYNDIYETQFDANRTVIDGAIGIDGSFGKNWKFNVRYGHGEQISNQFVRNATLFPQMQNALNAVRNASGQIVCGINADANPANDDPACAPLNPFGAYNASAAARAYTTGTERTRTISKLDTALAQIQGDLFSLWAGPITAVVGVEARWESSRARSGALDLAGAFNLPGVLSFSLFQNPTSGGFNVKEGFGEIAVPLIDVQDKVKIDLNGAARYSDYSTSGGIWSWKAGGTVRLFNDLLLRGTRSRDIRSPGIGELYGTRSLSVAPLVDPDTANRPAGYTSTPNAVQTFRGGNPDLLPEIGKTLTFGGSYSPSFIRGLSLSVDYYNIKIDGAIGTLSGAVLASACMKGSAAACARVIRDPVTETITTIFANSQNIASFKTQGLDFEASYVMRMSGLGLPGTLRIRALANHVSHFIYNTGAVVTDTAGDVGDATPNAIPKWRGTLSFSYQGTGFGLDARVRYVGSGLYDHNLTTLINNEIASRTYLDLGGQVKVNKRFTLFANVNNVFDRSPPISTSGPLYYDVIGTYFTVGARANF